MSIHPGKSATSSNAPSAEIASAVNGGPASAHSTSSAPAPSSAARGNAVDPMTLAVGPSVARRPGDTKAEDVVRCLRDDGTLDPRTDPRLTQPNVIALYKSMLRTRILDDRLVTLQRQGRIGFHIGSLGEEAAILGSAYAMRPQDWMFPCYREFGGALLRGLPLQRYLDNMFGNSNDPARGRQMPDHYAFKAAKVASISSPIGTQIPHAVGFSWAAKLKKDELVSIAYFGEGATSSSEFHNGLNFGGVFKVPVVFFCRNNGWAISVPTERQTASRTFAEKAIAYGMPGVRVDGNDVFAVVKVTRDAIERAARGDGPTLIEAMTYRLSGHSTSDDPNAYRPDATLDAWRAQDPLLRLKKHLAKTAGWTDTQDKELETELDAELKAAVKQAEATAPPALASMFDDVFTEQPWHLRQQSAELVAGPRAKGH